MSQASDYLEGQIRTHLFRTGSWTKPTQLHVALFTATPSDAGGGTEVSTSGTNYARAQLNPLDANWTAASSTDGVTTNAADLTFNAPSGAWGTVTSFGIYDASTAGNLLVWGALSAARTIGATDPAPKFLAGQLSITIA